VHPEQEIGAFFIEVQFAVPRLLGTIELIGTTGVSTVLGIVQQLVTDAEDGWIYMTERLGRLGDAEPSLHTPAAVC
jgi:predicted trehalose synthase